MEFGERLRKGEAAEEIRRSVRWRRPEKKVSIKHLAMARDAASRVEDVCVWLPEESAGTLIDELDALIQEHRHRHRQQERMESAASISAEAEQVTLPR